MYKESTATHSPLLQAAGTSPDAVAILGESPCSYSGLADLAETISALLHAQGLKPGDRVLILGAPSVEYCAILWGSFHASTIACPVNPAFPLETLKKIIGLLRPGCIVHDDAVSELADSLGLPALHFGEIREATVTRLRQEQYPNTGIPATVILTSGSSGLPKAAVHTLENHICAARAANKNLSLAPGDVWLLALPFFHVSGLSLLFRCALAGATVALCRYGTPLEDELVRMGATHVSLVPELARLVASPDGLGALQRMKGVLLGGAPAERHLIDRAFEAGVPLIRSYGMTETSAQICATAPGAPLPDLYSSGRPLVEGTVRIAETGEIEVKGPAVFAGYFRNGSVWWPGTSDGWFPTGDLGYLDEAGRLFITGRADAMFISGGENVHPEEIEAVLLTIPGVMRVVVVDVPDAEYGAQPVAFVRWACPVPPEPAALMNRLGNCCLAIKSPSPFCPGPNNLLRV